MDDHRCGCLMGYKVTSPLVCARDQFGKVRYHYQKAVIPWLEPGTAEYLLRIGMVEEFSDDDVPEGVEGVEEPDAEHYTAEGRPKQVAPKHVWERFRASQGVVTAEEAKGLTKQELVELD